MSENYSMSPKLASKLLAFDHKLVGFISSEAFMDIVEKKLKDYNPEDSDTTLFLTDLASTLRSELSNIAINGQTAPEILLFLSASLRDVIDEPAIENS